MYADYRFMVELGQCVMVMVTEMEGVLLAVVHPGGFLLGNSLSTFCITYRIVCSLFDIVSVNIISYSIYQHNGVQLQSLILNGHSILLFYEIQ